MRHHKEETLMQNTLWPEPSSPDASLLASSCKSSNAEHAQIILWNTATWKQIQKLSGHQLTVTQMRFSPNGEYLLSVSRDRRWSLFKRQPLENDTNKVASFALTACTDKTNGVHTRIIWSCDWSHDSKYFATSSREGKVVIWYKTEETETKDNNKNTLNGWKSLDVLELKNESITAITFAHSLHENGAYILALGCESGLIHVYQFKDKFTLLLSLNKSQSHHLTVKRLQFRPQNGDNKQFQLASCGEDYLVRVYQLNL
ncbi:probable elongator complex protein 2 [Lucilia sericata]|uniref:probable elongator complex protein 2 n=1 Tax=Lucilia sericata TaxID=13632 RepID=UPI0018A8692A|nr:probable elongator complex protein 2 [Lucilia sericata]